MLKLNIETRGGAYNFRSLIKNCMRSQRPIGRIKQGVCGKIIHRPEPFVLEDSPQSFGDVQKRTIWRKKEEEQSTFLPYRGNFLISFDL